MFALITPMHTHISSVDLEINVAWWLSLSPFKRLSGERLKRETDDHHAMLISMSAVFIATNTLPSVESIYRLKYRLF